MMEGRYDSLSKAESKIAQPWKQKSLDEKRLRFVMKRTSIPAHLAASANYVNHGVLTSYKAAAAAASSFPPSHSTESPKRLPMLSENQQLSFSEFSDSECLLEDSDMEGEGGISSSRNGPVGRFRDTGCQTGDDLVQVMFLQLRRRRFQNNPVSLQTSSSPRPHPRREGEPVKEVTFSTQVVPVHVDSAWSQSSEQLKAPENQPLLGCGDFLDDLGSLDRLEGEDGMGVDGHRRLSNLSSQSYRDGGSSSTSEAAHQNRMIRRCSDTAEASTHHHHHHSIYHRPPTPRTPRKLLIQNNHNDISADGGGSSLQALPRDSLPSPHVLHVNRTPSATPTSPSLSSLLSQGSCPEGARRRGEGEEEGGSSGGEASSSSPGRKASTDKGVIEFQQYLLNRGMSLDMTTVQTSNL
ncbi:hypothetical protein ACOMHN_023189 [Nucella lapillus]